MKNLVKLFRFCALLFSLVYLTSCTVWNYQQNYQATVDRVIIVDTSIGKKQLTLEQEMYPVIKDYVMKNGNPDYIYKDGKRSIYFIYNNSTTAHFTINAFYFSVDEMKVEKSDSIPKEIKSQIDLLQ